MCPNQNWFSTYETASKSAFMICKNASCRVDGIGIVIIKMFDGVIRIFGDVRHVPDLKKDLISLSTLYSKRV